MIAVNPYTSFGVVDRNVATGVAGVEFLRQMLRAAHPAPPFTGATDIWIAAVEEGRVMFEGLPSERFYNPLGTVHGGWLAALLDSAMGCAVHSLLKPGQAYTTVEMKVNFVRPVVAATGKVRCEGAIIHSGGRIATSEGKVIDAAGKLIAHGTETCLIFDAQPPSKR